MSKLILKVTSNHSLFDVEIEKEIGCKDHQVSDNVAF